MSKDLFQNNDYSWSLVESKYIPYELKVPLKIEGKRIFIDIESAINSDQHSIQSGWNYFKGIIASYVTNSYTVSSYQLHGILATAAEVDILPMTSDAGPLTDSWWIISIWLDFAGSDLNGVLHLFKSKYPDCQEIILTTSSVGDTSVDVIVYNDSTITGFEQLKMHGASIDLSDIM